MRSYISKSDIKKVITVALKKSALNSKDNELTIKLAKQFNRLSNDMFPNVKMSNSMNQDDCKTIIGEPVLVVRSKDDLYQDVYANDLKHDIFFNHKRKAVYESLLSQLFLIHRAPFMNVIKKVSDLISPDINNMLKNSGNNKHSISTKMSHYFLNDFDIKSFFGKYVSNFNQFREEVIRVLNSNNSEDFYKHISIQRAYITFFTEKGLPKPEMEQAIKQKWTAYVDLEHLLCDIRKFREDEIYFKNNRRLDRYQVINKTTKNIGILPPDDYQDLPWEDRQKLEGTLPRHRAGMLEFIITTEGRFAASGMFNYDMPQLCGPSGNTAMRLALANQASLNVKEKKLFNFAISLYHVSVGSHSIDECFMMANDTDFNSYIRGNYTSIIPEVIKTQIEFRELWVAIQALNKRYKDILYTISTTNALDAQPVRRAEMSVLNSNTSDQLEYLDLADARHQPISQEKKISHLIRSLKDNYFTYGLVMASNEHERQVRDKKDFYSGFFALPRVSLPKIKDNSNFIIWQRFVRKVFEFFDGENREKFILELQKLERKICEISKNTEIVISPDELLEQILSEFEKNSGFSSVFNIKATDGVGGIITPSEFKKLLAAGHPINDLGTTFQLEQHGKLSHRLQFYILGEYFKENVSEFFSQKDLNDLIEILKIQYPMMLNSKNQFPIDKIISVFYRLLGTEEFNNSFDWKAFVEERAKLNLYYNKQHVPPMLNMGNIWVQLFDRYGYAGYFSVPSTFGFLQKLGCFSILPKIGEPKVKTNRHLKTILDITPRFFHSKDKSENKTLLENNCHNYSNGILHVAS